MQGKFKTRVYTGFALAIIMCAISGLSSYLILQKQQKQRNWVKKARSILDTTTNIQNQLIEMETGRRGFRATNQKRFLEPYYNGLKRIIPALAQLKTLLSDDTELGKQEMLLDQHVNTLLVFWKSNGDNADAYTRGFIIKMTDDEKKQMDETRTIIAGLQKDEAKLLNTQREEYDQLIHYANVSSIIDSAISEAIILILIVIIIREFKSRRKIQEQLRASVAQLKEQTSTLQKSQDELKLALKQVEIVNKQLEKYVYTVAHDVKSPLAGIIGMFSLIKRNNTVLADPELTEFIDLSSEAAMHLNNMVESLLEYSKISIDQQQLEDVNVKLLIKELTALLFPPKNIQIIVAGKMPVFKTKKLKIEQVFQNLISNAIKYNDKTDGIINVGFEDKGDFYQFFVKDNGQGIPKQDWGNVFALSKAGSNKATRETSTGFGLNIIKLIVEEQGGKIWFDTTTGEGSTFYFEWHK